jgi:hypothetical protein
LTPDSANAIAGGAGTDLWASIRQLWKVPQRAANMAHGAPGGPARQDAETAASPLTPGDRARFSEWWDRVQTWFAEDPGRALAEADRLAGNLMSASGYAVDHLARGGADAPADRALVVQYYRAAGRAAAGREHASVEDQRQAMIFYRRLVAVLTRRPDDRAAGDTRPL